MPNALPASAMDRREERFHLFLIATLYAGPSAVPVRVRVRNLSSSGALVEGGALPIAGTPIMLRRGQLEAAGTIMWAKEGRAGLSLSGSVAVAAWLPAKACKGQAEVDRIAHAVRGGLADCVMPVATPVPSTATLSLSAALAEIVSCQEGLQRLSDSLADDGEMVTRHPQIQFLDEVGQRLAKIAAAFSEAVSARRAVH